MGALVAGSASAQAAAADAQKRRRKIAESAVAVGALFIGSAVTEKPASIASRNKNDRSVAITRGRSASMRSRPRRCPYALPDQARDHGARSANVAVEAAPFGLEKATIDASIDRIADQGKVSTSFESLGSGRRLHVDHPAGCLCAR